MRTLLLIPSVLAQPRRSPGGDTAPTMDYHALAGFLGARYGRSSVTLCGYAEVDACTDPVVAGVRRCLGRDAALATYGFRRRREVDAIFSNGENVGIPLALLLRADERRRPRHVCIGHRLSPLKKRFFLKTLGLHRQMDTLFVYSTAQRTFGAVRLGIPLSRLPRIAFHADLRFWQPSADTAEEEEGLICSAGLEWRDYPTLIEALRQMPQSTLAIAAASPWSKRPDQTAGRELPNNVRARRYDYAGLRELYSRSQIVAVPLYENDFQAGVTTLLEAMAMGKAVVCTRTAGQRDVILDGFNGLYVAPGDVAGWRRTLDRLLADASLRRRLGENARCWVCEHASLDRWVSDVAAAAIRGTFPVWTPETMK